MNVLENGLYIPAPDGVDALSDAVGQPNPFAKNFLSPTDAFTEHQKTARVFHINYDLWMALGGDYEDTGLPFRFEELRDAQWPFDDVTIMPRKCPRLPFEDNPNRFYQQSGIAFAKRPIVEGTFGVQVVDSFLTASGMVYDSSNTFFSRLGMSLPHFPDRIIEGRQVPVPESARKIEMRQVWSNFNNFAAFCDMLRYCGSIIELRHISRDKKKRTTMDAVRKQNYRDVEIVLSPKLTVYEITERIIAGRKSFNRAHPRRHDVREHIRVLSDGRIVIVNKHERGGIAGPGPAYNCGPISRWYTQQNQTVIA